MNRKIKFRAWDKVKKTMYYQEGDKLCLFFSDNSIISNYGCYTTVNPDIELMQFMGLMDIQGNEIYEGDIVLEHDLFYKKLIPGLRQCMVDNGCVKFFPTTHKEAELCEEMDISFESLSTLPSEVRFLIIGNIYENPELSAKKGKLL